MEWLDAHDGSPAQTGYVDGRLVAQVAYYDIVAGRGPGWVGYVRGERVTGRCTDSATARLVVEARSIA
jgi:hypothetical protein